MHRNIGELGGLPVNSNNIVSSGGNGYGNFGSGLSNWWTGNTDWERQNIMFDKEVNLANTAYQRAVADMKKAGLNPAMMYGSGGSSAYVPSSRSQSSGSGVGALLGLIINSSFMLANKGMSLAKSAKAMQNTANFGSAERDFNLMYNAYTLGRHHSK